MIKSKEYYGRRLLQEYMEAAIALGLLKVFMSRQVPNVFQLAWEALIVGVITLILEETNPHLFENFKSGMAFTLGAILLTGGQTGGVY